VVELDVTRRDSLERARDAIAERTAGAGPWALVNNAGIVAAGPIEVVDLDALREVFEVNVFGLVAATQVFLPGIRAAKGRIVNLSSLSGLLAVPFLGPYNATKFAVEGISDTLRREVQSFGVDVVVIQPGVTRTPLWKKAEEIDLGPVKGTPYEEVAGRVRDKAVRKGGRGQPPAEVARAVLRALTETPPPTRIRVQRKRKSRLRYSLLPLLPDRFIDRLVAERIQRP
jgi:NAD(P)-dependent dehydrogenase (short-subunit alcohol dehydrogenase family)